MGASDSPGTEAESVRVCHDVELGAKCSAKPSTRQHHDPHGRSRPRPRGADPECPPMGPLGTKLK